MRLLSVGLCALDGQADLEAGGSRFGVHCDGPGVHGHDAVDRVETEAETLLRVCHASRFRVTDGARRPSRKSGGGFGSYEQNLQTERAAIRATTIWLRRHNWTVRSVERENLGYDLEALRNGEVAHVEVKGVKGSGLAFPITQNEVRQADEDPAHWLCVVTDALHAKKRALNWWTGDQLRRFDLRPVGYVASPARARAKGGPT